MDERKFLLAVIVLGLLFLALWPWHVLLGIAAILIGLLLGGVRGWMALQHHQVDIEAKKRKALVIHETDKGVVYVEGDRISGYSHVLPQAKVQEKAVGATVPLPERPPAPSSFSELVRGGYVAPGSDFVLGFDERADPIRMPTLTSLGIGGGQGFGKTSTAFLVMLEAIVKYGGEVEFLEIDPHLDVAGEESLYAKTKSLEPFFMSYHEGLGSRDFTLPNPVGLFGEEDKVEAWVEVWNTQFQWRMRGGEGPMWVMVIDEGAAVFSSRVSKKVSKLLENINRQARKVKMFAIVISQEWKASRTGGSEMRDSIVTYMLHNTPERISSLLVPSDVARQTPRLRIGEAILYCQGTDRRGMVPQVSVEDAERLVRAYRPMRVVDVTPRLLGEGHG